VYGIPEGVDWSFMLGAKLNQVCIGLYQVTLALDGDISITIECEFEHVRPQPVPEAQAALSHRAKTLVESLGDEIIEVTRESQWTLAIRFAGSGTLKIHDSNVRYESFQIVSPKDEIIV
jgi:hypothetical protein